VVESVLVLWMGRCIVRGQGHCGRFGRAPGDLLVKLQVG
jgi:hypothetical protein